MNTIRVLSPGLFTTVQDLGREGFGPMGVSASGAADSLALRLGNRLAANAENAAALEMTLMGGVFQFPQGAVAALAGSDFGATLDGAAIPAWMSFEIGAGQTLRTGHTQSGARCYLCVRGGIAVTPFLGSASTHILSGLGGFEGRPLRKGDILHIGPRPAPSFRKRALRRGDIVAPRRILRVTDGVQSDWFDETAHTVFYSGVYRVSEEANRMGLRLEGPPLEAVHAAPMISEGAPLGAIQIPAGGLPIILFVEQQTAGGYPKIANIVAADLSSVGQLRPRDEIRFERVNLETARRLLQEQEDLMASAELLSE